MNGWVYLLVAFITLFVMWKRRGDEVLESSTIYAPVESSAFWDILLTALLWPAVIPGKALWYLMDRIYYRFNQKPKNDDDE